MLDKPDILLVNPASPTALNPTLQQACDQGIVVAVFDSSTDLECAYIVTNSFGDWARLSTKAIIDGIGGKGNVIIARGVQGSPPEIEMYAVQTEMLKANPDVKVVGEFFTFCDAAKAQEALLGTIASLPDVDGVIGCGEGLGAVQAFQTAGREIPVVAFAPSGRALKFWGEGNGAPGSVAVMSDPGQGVAALFTAINIYKGQKVPRITIFPPVVVSDKARDEWIAAVGDDEIASWQWTKELVDAQTEGEYRRHGCKGRASAGPGSLTPIEVRPAPSDAGRPNSKSAIGPMKTMTTSAGPVVQVRQAVKTYGLTRALAGIDA